MSTKARRLSRRQLTLRSIAVFGSLVAALLVGVGVVYLLNLPKGCTSDHCDFTGFLIQVVLYASGIWAVLGFIAAWGIRGIRRHELARVLDETDGGRVAAG